MRQSHVFKKEKKGKNKMSEDTTTVEDTSAGEVVKVKKEKKVREAKKNSVLRTELDAMVDGIPSYEKASFTIVGYKGGVRLALPKTVSVSRAYFYADDDYSLVPDHAAITKFSEEDRKQRRLGGIMAEVDFSNLDSAREALVLLVEAVKNAKPKQKPEKKPREKKAKNTTPAADAEQASAASE